jgi:outer membrane protein
VFIAHRPRVEDDPLYAVRLAIMPVVGLFVGIALRSPLASVFPVMMYALMATNRKAFDPGRVFAAPIIFSAALWIMSGVVVTLQGMPLALLAATALIYFTAFYLIQRTGNAMGLLLIVAMALMSIMALGSYASMSFLRSEMTKAALATAIVSPILYWLLPAATTEKNVDVTVPAYDDGWAVRAAIRTVVMFIYTLILFTFLDASNIFLAIAGMFVLVQSRPGPIWSETRMRIESVLLGGVLAIAHGRRAPAHRPFRRARRAAVPGDPLARPEHPHGPRKLPALPRGRHGDDLARRRHHHLDRAELRLLPARRAHPRQHGARGPPHLLARCPAGQAGRTETLPRLEGSAMAHFVSRTRAAMLIAALLAGPTQAQSISEALVLAYGHSPDIQSALLEAKIAAENIAMAQSAQRPTIGASLGGAYNWSLVNDSLVDSTALTTGLSYNHTVFDSGRTEAQVEAARAGAEAAEHQIRNTVQNVFLAVVDAYMAVLRDTQLADLRRDDLQFYRAQLESVQSRIELGEATQVELAQARARLAQGEAAYTAAAGTLEISRASFARQVGRAPRALSPQHGFAPLLPPNLETAVAIAEAEHPGLRVTGAAIRAAQANVDAAQAAFGPRAGITGSLGTRYTGPGGAPTDGISGSIGFQVTVPLYSGGATGAGVRQANLQQIQSEVAAWSTADQIREATIAAWNGIQNADAQISAARLNPRRARRHSGIR